MGFKESLIVSEEEQLINLLQLERYRKILLGPNGDKTELYLKIESLYRKNPEGFKETLASTLFKVEIYVKDTASEVFDGEHVDDETEMSIKQEILNELLDVVGNDYESLISRRRQMKQKLCEARNDQLADFEDEELKDIAKMIEETLDSNLVKRLMREIFEDESCKGEHSRLNLQGSYLGNLQKMELVIKLIADYVIVNRENAHIGEYIDYLQHSELSKRSLEEINEIVVDFYINYMRKNFPQMDDDEIFKKIYDAYEKNGFLFQGINGTFLEITKQNGLTGKFSAEGLTSMQRVNEIFMRHGVKNILLSKLQEMKVDPEYYYVTEDFAIAEHFSFHNPEYMSMLFGTGPYLADEQEFDQLAFYIRNKDSCINNVRKLCERYSLSEDEEKEIIEIATRALDYTGNLANNGILITPKRIVKKVCANKKQHSEKDLQDRLLDLLDCRKRNSYRCYISIPPKAVAGIEVTTLQELLGKTSNLQEGDNAKKYVQVRTEDGNKIPFYYDILIKSEDTSDLDCIEFKEDQKLPEIESFKTKDNSLTVDAIKCNSRNLGYFDKLEADNTDAQPSFQSLMMMMAVNGVANSKEGELVLNKARKEFTPKKMSQYYFFLTKKFIGIAKDNTYTSRIRLEVAKRIIGDLLPKATYMGLTNRYPVDIRPEFLSKTQYDFGQEETIIDKITDLQINLRRGESNVLISELDEIFEKVREVLDRYYSFDEDYMEMCENWINRLNFEQELQQCNRAMLKGERLEED